MGNFAPHKDNLMLGKGQFFAYRFSTAGVKSADLYHMGNVNNAEIQVEDDTIELRSSMTKAAGVLKKVTKSRTVTLKLTGNDYALKNIALMLMGQEATFSQTTGSVTGEALTGGANAIKGAHYRTAFRGVSALAVKQGVTVLVAGTDYLLVDPTGGVIRLLETSVTITGASPLTCDYTKATITAQPIIRPFTDTDVQGQIVFIGDPTSGPVYEAIFWYVNYKPDGSLGLIQDDWGEWNLDLTVQDDTPGLYGGSANEPYGRIYERTAGIGN
jgi:hypothetical protein